MSVLFEPLSILRWLPDETVFSLASRHHKLTGNALPSTTCRQLFGHSRLGSQHDFPCRIDALAARLLGLLGDPESIICQHTVLPFYLAFRDPTDTSHAYATIRGPAIGSLKYRLGILTSRFGASHPLKACLCCFADDIALHGIAYWHRDHQLPGVWVCRTHRSPLQAAHVKANGIGRFLWFLPNDIGSHLWFQPASSLTLPALERLSALAEFAHRLCLMPAGSHFEPQNLVRVYRSELHRQGLTRGEGLQLQIVGDQFASFVEPLRKFAELEALPSDSEKAAAQVARLVREPRSGTHPLRHLALIAWLFGTWDAFSESYERDDKLPRNQHWRMPSSQRSGCRQLALRTACRTVTRRTVLRFVRRQAGGRHHDDGNCVGCQGRLRNRSPTKGAEGCIARQNRSSVTLGYGQTEGRRSVFYFVTTRHEIAQERGRTAGRVEDRPNRTSSERGARRSHSTRTRRALNGH